jgi:hypothetical protein
MPVEVRKADRVANYTKRWEENAQDDNETHRQNRLDDYTELVNGAVPSPPSPTLHVAGGPWGEKRRC